MTPSAYRNPLEQNTTLAVFNDDECIFTSEKKWLHPLFDLESFLQNFENHSVLSAHDTAIGKAAAVLMTRMGITFIHAELISRLALSYLEQFCPQVTVSYSHVVDRLMCATEAQLEPLSDADEMYYLLRKRAKLTQGVSLQLDHVSHPYGNLCDISFSLSPGDRLMVTGENGTGKTTLLSLIAGILKPTSGRIFIDGRAAGKQKKRTVGFIPQFTVQPHFSLSVSEVVGLGLDVHTKNKEKEIEQALERTSSLHLASRDFATLSGGEKQKVSLSRCLAQHAKLLLLDEPTASLDSENKQMVVDIVRSLTLTEIPTIIIVTHDPELTSLARWNTFCLKEET